MTVVNKLSGYTDVGDVLRLRHCCVWLVRCTGLLAFYWGLSFRQGLEWVLRHNTRPVIRVRTNLPATDVRNRHLLPPADRARLVMQRYPDGPAEYFITTYRYHPQPYNGLGLPAYSLRVEADGRRIFDIFRLR